MDLQTFQAVPTWVSTLTLCLSIALPTTLWQAFDRAGTEAKIDGARTTSIWLAVFLSIWVVLAVFLSLLGFFEADPVARLPHLAYSLLPLIAGVILWPVSRRFRETLLAVRPDWLIRLQTYRVLGGIYLVCWHRGLMPAPFAFPAGVGDLLVGSSALLVAWMVRHQRPGAALAAKFWNFFGLADVLTAVTMGVLTSPNPLQVLSKDAPDVAIAAFPLSLLTTIVVPLSVLCHIYSLRVGARAIRAR